MRTLFFLKRGGRRGTVLILALWALGLLTVLAVNLHFMVRQKLTLLSRLEQRARLKDAANAGIRQAIAVLRSMDAQHGRKPTVAQKILRFLYREQFQNVNIGQANFEVGYIDYTYGTDLPLKMYGFTDEEGRLNVNTADPATIQRLIESVTGMPAENAGHLALAIVGWREEGDTQLKGFYGDDYYANLEFPYQRKQSKYERLDELRLVEGMSLPVYEQLIPFVTVYGTGLVNINTASRPVLEALGLSENIVNAVLTARSGPDGEDATADDFIFEQVIDPAAYANVLPLEQEEYNDIARLAGVSLGTDTSYYRMISTGHAGERKQSRVITCVYDLGGKRIVYWRQQPGNG